MSKPQVIFFTVQNASEKIQVIQKTIQTHIQNKENIKILVPDFTTLDFLSNVLWTLPKESFLPHSCSLPQPFQDRVLLTTPPLAEEDNYPFVFNLCPQPQSIPSGVKTLYELEDIKQSQKISIFQEKIQYYKNKNYIISSAPSS